MKTREGDACLLAWRSEWTRAVPGRRRPRLPYPWPQLPEQAPALLPGLRNSQGVCPPTSNPSGWRTWPRTDASYSASQLSLKTLAQFLPRNYRGQSEARVSGPRWVRRKEV